MYQQPAAPYQQPPQPYNQGQYPPPQQGAQAYGQQPTYQQHPHPPYQQPYQQAYQQGSVSQAGPPQQGYGAPPKKKGNPVITKYAPPPGYRGPAAPGGPNHYQGPQAYAQQGYPPQSGYGPPQNAYPPQPGYPQPPQYPPQHATPSPNWQHHQGYPPQQSYPYASQQGYDQSGYQQPSYPPQQGYNPYHDPSQQWQQQPPYPSPLSSQDSNYTQQNGYNAQQPPYHGPNQGPYQQPGPTPPQSATTNSENRLPQSDNDGGSRNMSISEDACYDYDYWGESLVKDSDSIDPNLSIGIIVWHPANSTSRALPSTFAEAERDMAEAVRKSDSKKRKLDDEATESVSKYFAGESAEESLLNVRQTREWENVKDDLIFVEFPSSFDVIPLHEVIANRNRPEIEEEAGSEMDIEEGEDSELPPPEQMNHEGTSDVNVVDSLEQALFSSDFSTGNKPGSEATILTSPGTGNPDQNPPQPLQPVRDFAQEDILAKLGVSGSPKPVYPTPGPAYMLPPEDLHISQAQQSSLAEGPGNTGNQEMAEHLAASENQMSQENQPKPENQDNQERPEKTEGQERPERPGRPERPERADGVERRERATPRNGTRFHKSRRGPGHKGNEEELDQPHQFLSHPPPPPPEPEKSPEYDPWRANEAGTRRGAALDGTRDSPGARSDNSQHTLVGSDFHPDGDGSGDAFNPNSEVKRKPKPGRTGSGLSRKRSYNDYDDHDDEDERRRQEDDVTPRWKKRQPKVAEAYGRRW